MGCGDLLEMAAAVIEIEPVGEVQIGDEKIEVAVVIDIAPGGAGGAGQGVTAGDAPGAGAFAEMGHCVRCGRTVVDKKKIGLATARHEEVGVAVVVDIREGRATAAAVDAQPRCGGDILEDAGAVIEIEVVGRILVGEIEIDGAIAVDIRPDGGAGACQAIVDAGETALFAEAARSGLAVEQIVAVEGGNQEILVAVVVDVGCGGSFVIIDDATGEGAAPGQPHLGRGFDDRLIAPGRGHEIEMVGGAGNYRENILIAIAVEIGDRHAVFSGIITAALQIRDIEQGRPFRGLQQPQDEKAFVALLVEEVDGEPDIAALLTRRLDIIRDPVEPLLVE